MKRLTLLLLLAASGCAEPPFIDRYAKINMGLDRATVEDRLGKPDSVKPQTLPSTPFMGPAASLMNLLQPGQAYEEWSWTRNQNIHLVWFAAKDEQAEPDTWRVVSKMDYPEGSVF